MEAQVVSQDFPKLLDRLCAEIRLRHDSLRISRRVWLRTPLRYQGKFVLKIRVTQIP